MQTISAYLLMLLSVSFSALAQVSLKYGMSLPSMQQALAGGNWWAITQAIASDMSIIAGFILYGLSAVIWLFVLARLDLSVAYPFVAIGFVITMAVGCILFGEAFTLQKAVGTAVVGIGVYLVATS